MPYRGDDVEPTAVSGPATLYEKTAAYLGLISKELSITWILMTLLVMLFGSAGRCTSRWDEEVEQRCKEACALSGDIHYQAEAVNSCMCLTLNGSRYQPFQEREVCAQSKASP